MKTLLKGVTNTTLPNYTPVFGELLANTDTMSIQAGDDATPGGVTVSGVIGFVVVTPSLSSPVDGDVLRAANLTITTTSFDGQGEHASTRYQIATDALFTQIVFNRDDAVNLLSIVPADHGFTPLDDVTYYIRAQHNSSVAGLSDWSTVVVVTLRRDLPLTFNGLVNAGDGSAGDYYGIANDTNADGSVLVVGAYGCEKAALIDAGAAYVYDKDGAGTYQQTIKIQAADAVTADYFGYGIAVSDDGLVLAVGAIGRENSGKTNVGQVYVYKRVDLASAFVLSTTVIPSATNTGQYFGCRVALSADGSVMAVGAYGYHAGGLVNAGGVFTYIDNGSGTYVEKEIIISPVPTAGSIFGYSVALTSDGSKLAIGEPSLTVSGVTNAGKVHIYARQLDDTYLPDANFTSHVVPLVGARFGVDVSFDVDGSFLLVGAHTADVGGIVASGAAYLMEYLSSAYTPINEYHNAIPDAGEGWGVSTAMSRDGKIAAFGASFSASNQGSMSIFKHA